MRTKLLKLQELENAIRATASIGQKKRLKSKINALKSQLPPNVCDRFYKLYKRNGAAIVQANGGICHGCYLNLPSSQANEVKFRKTLHTCQNCGCFLYVESEEKLAIF